MKIDFAVALVFFLLLNACASAADNEMPCANSKIQTRRSEELQRIQEEDQADRQWQVKGIQPTQKILEEMSQHDLKRRKRVGEIFGEGCFKSVADYKAAFIVYQHGNTSDQYFQAFLWAKEALTLGDIEVKSDVAMAIDRYLVSSKHMQLFGTQATEPSLGGCWCIQPIEESFPETLREEFRGGRNAAYTGLAYLKTLNKDNGCSAAYCSTDLLRSPQGTVPGFW